MAITFLAEVAKQIKNKHPEGLKDIVLVFSNRRAKTFIINEFAKLYGDKPIWLPQIFSTDDFVQYLTRSSTSDTFALQLTLFEAYTHVLGKKAEPFDEFFKWAPTLLNDFDEIDQQLVDAQAIFSYLSDDKAIEVWNLNRKPLTALQSDYLHFYRNMYPIYQEYRRLLAEKKQYYRGYLYKSAANSVESNTQIHALTKIYFCGLNALLNSEKKLINHLVQMGKAELIWDADEYYLNNPLQEAGVFLREHQAKWGKIENVKSNELSKPRTIHVSGAELNTGQVVALQSVLKEKHDAGRLDKTVLVLSDESILNTVLNNLPDFVTKANVTIGYSLQFSQPALFTIELFELANQVAALQITPAILKYTLKKLLKNPIVKNHFKIDDERIHEISNQWAYDFFHHSKPKDFQLNDESVLIKLIFDSIRTPFALLYYLTNENWWKEQPVGFENNWFVNEVDDILKDVYAIAFSAPFAQSAPALSQVVTSRLKAKKIPFEGSPTGELQIMGILETRNLDFEDVIMLSVNEGILPEQSSNKSFITNDIKRMFGLPLYMHREAVFSYHFYRLLQRASNVHLFYNSSKTENSSGEPSRFILQLMHEWSNEERKIIHRKFKSTYSDSLSSEPAFPINESALERLHKWLSTGISFSALNTFAKCSLQFYFKYILKIVTADEDDSDDIVLGNLIHKALENVYGKWINQSVEPEWLEKVDALQELKLAAQHIQMPSFADGKMAILFDAAVYLFQKTIDFDLNKVKKGDELVILSLESKFSRIYKLKSGFEVKIDGKIDRVDLLNDTVRLIDYKTGAVTKKLSLKAEDALNTTDKDKEKQLMVYRWVTQSEYPTAESMIYPIQNLSDNEAVLQAEHSILMSKMDEFLNLTVENMLSTDTAFVQTDNHKTCEFCDFASICKRD